MKMTLSVYYTDGTSGMIEFEKPPGAHPDSMAAVLEGLLTAEKTGKIVARIGREFVNPFSKPPGPLVIDDQRVITRDQLLSDLKKYSPHEYERLFGNIPL